MISALELKGVVGKRWPDAEIVGSSVVRFTKRANGQEYAVIYLDVSRELPDDSKALSEFQQKVIGSRYFEGAKSLQWSNYLYFVRDAADLKDSKALTSAKLLIESDRTFARKRLISFEQVASVLDPPVVEESEEQPKVGLLSAWLKVLEDAGIQDAIVGDYKMPARIKKIEQAVPVSRSFTEVERAAAPPAQGLRSLKLLKYRPFPLRREYDFGRVNLLFGPNGVGKTSLLEAIELFYCGKTNRNPRVSSNYEFSGVLSDGTEERASSNRALQLFRDRNLNWYGQPEVNTANLYQSFAQFNFLNTDAAVGLATSTQNMEDELSKLLVGPDVSRIWDNIQRVFDEVTKELRGLHELRRQFTGELTSIGEILEAGTADQQLSSVLLEQFQRLLVTKKWIGFSVRDRAALLQGLVKLAEAEQAVSGAVQLVELAGPITIDGISASLGVKKERLQQTERALLKIDRLGDEARTCGLELEREGSRKRVLEGFLDYLKSRFRARLQEACSIESRKRALLELLQGVGDAERAFSPEVLSLTIQRAFEQSAMNVAVADTALQASRSELAEMQTSLTNYQNLGQRLREIAGTILANQDEKDECPLCHTRFADGALHLNVQSGLDTRLERAAQQALELVSLRETELSDGIRRKEQFATLFYFAERLGKEAHEVTVKELIQIVSTLSQELTDVTEKSIQIEGVLAELESTGLTEQDLLEKEGWLIKEGFELEVMTLDEASRQVHLCASKMSTHATERGRLTAEMEKACFELASLLDSPGAGIDELRQAQRDGMEWVVYVEAAISKMQSLSPDVSFPTGLSLSELKTEIVELRQKGLAVEESIGRESAVGEQRAQAAQRKAVIEEKLAAVTTRGKSFQNAQRALRNIREERSLTGAVDESLKRNRAAIEKIFSQIHTPDEFTGIGRQLGRLVRRVDNSDTALSEISTGQRAAYALSLFLAQNAQLRDGPPVLLIDDPVAHVDDMNFLSLLDYLREVVIRTDRQIFFATASEKVAALFERKFDFLGASEFCRFNVARQ